MESENGSGNKKMAAGVAFLNYHQVNIQMVVNNLVVINNSIFDDHENCFFNPPSSIYQP